jgi:AraC-like DNA-binding protein
MESSFFGATNINIPGLAPDFLIAPDVEPLLKTGSQFGSLAEHFSALVRESMGDARFSKEITYSFCRLILLEILRVLPTENERSLIENGCFREAKHYIDENFAKLRNVDELCRKLHVSHSYLDHVFKRCGEVSPLRYIISRRLDQAKAMLATRGLSVEQIAFRCGFEDESYFYRAFKEYTGQTPAKFRRENLN